VVSATGFERVGDSGYVRKPVYLLKEVNSGWRSLAAVVGTGMYQDLRPIRFLGPEYRSNPIVRGSVELVSNNYEHVLGFLEYP
jgi:hypothetical protein